VCTIAICHQVRERGRDGGWEAEREGQKGEGDIMSARLRRSQALALHPVTCRPATLWILCFPTHCHLPSREGDEAERKRGRERDASMRMRRHPASRHLPSSHHSLSFVSLFHSRTSVPPSHQITTCSLLACCPRFLSCVRTTVGRCRLTPSSRHLDPSLTPA